MACWTVLTTCVILLPRWSTLAIVGGLLLVASLVVRLPLSVAPRPPMWFVSGFIGGCLGAWLGDGLELFLRVSTLALVVLWGSGLIAWVTPTASLAAALRFFLRPLRLLGAPVDQWSLVMASALRGLPMLRDQAQAVLDTAKLRLGQDMATLSLRGSARLSVDVITAILSATSRGAAETGRAMSMRGSIEAQDGATRGARVRLGWVDAAVIAASLLGIAGIVACRLMP
ncbi:cobalt transporter [Schaalia odontolytica]|uniref:Cobalt transporter n=1 Tax=Schaalia odontolytica TaxID=1660 RepID=A0A857AA76_9ACTO|nr:cobalt transporter [Schaalia odontolytica]